ncbi:hypothetical protein FisN_3Lh456 [Fistulifera solaris]|uniref:C2H2-type domain-containing protein n=1 Tax=Fistulifera solaris TaxID=1519565 RepID=A0A1Z5J8C6_FISSO|nr:hypothetical protein FisN_3Lh456 [Fistulifera solaris]|eukprot:GAX10254.1 hypothetical protein FisN_3Lh456 [Fistulifera solaris]
MSSTSKQRLLRHDRALEALLHKRVGKNTEQARRSAELAAEQIWKTLQDRSHNTLASSPFTGISPSLDQCSIDSSQESNASSSERAIRRGWRRGARDTNEADSVLRDVLGAELPSVDETTATLLTGDILAERRVLKGGKRKRGLFQRTSRSSGSTIFRSRKHESDDGHAWMCGVCGQAFATHEAADQHETKHVQDVVDSLGWGSSRTALREVSFPDASDGTRLQRQMQLNIQHPISTLEQWGKEDEVLEQQQVRVGVEGLPSDEISLLGSFLKKGLEYDASSSIGNALVPKRRASTFSDNVRYKTNADPLLVNTQSNLNRDQGNVLLLSKSVLNSAVLADEALISVCRQAEKSILSASEKRAERELDYLSQDKAYYDKLAAIAAARQARPTDKYRSDGDGVIGKVQNKFLDAYQIMKETDQGGAKTGLTSTDQYDKRWRQPDGNEADDIIRHSSQTMYVNVMVRNSIVVVKRELERLADKRWEKSENNQLDRFERFRVFAHLNIVKLAGIALASDFTPRRIAVQLSNDLYRLLTPRLQRRGVNIETEIEYRVGPYFVLAVNVTSIDWVRLIKATHKDVERRQARWRKERKEHNDEYEASGQESLLTRLKNYGSGIRDKSLNDWIEQSFYLLYFLHWSIYLPLCYIVYYGILGRSIRNFIISSVTDEIFFYAEKRGMEMEIRIREATKQTAFMLSALREIRADGRALAKRRQESEKQEKGKLLGPLLGPAIKSDSEPAIKPDGFVVPDNLEFIGLELDLPVGFKRLRWALLSNQSTFVLEALYKAEAKYENISLGRWDKHAEHIGLPVLPDSVKEEDFIGSTKEGSYLMPKSAFVAANTCYETHFLVAYNDYCFCLKKRARNPEAPFGKSFVAWTQYLVVNLGNNSCRLVCSVEAEFPNGEPMVARQIRSGMRAGTGDLFVLTGETISKYAAEYP